MLCGGRQRVKCVLCPKIGTGFECCVYTSPGCLVVSRQTLITHAEYRRSMRSERLSQTCEDALWYKDAIIYELHVRAFYDSNGDGNGDFRGLAEKLDYLRDLGVTALWLLPFYPSPLRDDGYDIADYRNVHPDYGTRRDFRHFVQEAHVRGL